MINTVMILMSAEKSSDDNKMGGGNILQYIGNGESSDKIDQMSSSELLKFASLPIVKYIAIALIIIVAISIIFRLYNIKTVRRGKGALKELKNIDSIRKKEKQIIAINNAINKITAIVSKSPFRMSKAEAKELQYKLRRADIKSLGNKNIMKAEMYHSILTMVKVVVVAVGILAILFVNMAFGAILIVMDITLVNTISDIWLREKVKEKDLEIKENFTSFYLMLHYVMIRNPKAPLINIIHQYDKTTDSSEMHKFVDICTHNFNTYGEYTGSSYVSEEYKAVGEVVKLMRLIRQACMGADIKSELNGFKQELINEEAYRAERKKKKALELADKAKIIVMIILAQGVISAMTIYLSDIGGSSLGW